MRAWHFSEQSYAPAWDKAEPMKITIPSELFDPETASNLLNRHLDEWIVADELGLDIMVNEHHSTLSCMSPSPTLPLAILARETRNARLLALGIPLGNRPDPFRIAEEIALVDLISRGRMEMGFVKGSGWEIFSSNLNPARFMDRFWESHDLILKALTTLDGPFSWEGEFFQYRYVNVQPRCYQQPHPPIWMTSTSPWGAGPIGAKGYVMASPMVGEFVKHAYDAYKAEYLKAHGHQASNDRLAYLALVAVGNSEKEARVRAEKVKEHLRTQMSINPAFVNPPGYANVAGNVQGMRAAQRGPGLGRTLDGKGLDFTASIDELGEAGVLFWGTPDQVYDQIESFYHRVGGFGHMMMEAQAGHLTYNETVNSLSLFSEEVLPRLQELSATHALEEQAI